MAIAFSCLDLSRKYIILAPEIAWHFKMSELLWLHLIWSTLTSSDIIWFQVVNQWWGRVGSHLHSGDNCDISSHSPFRDILQIAWGHNGSIYIMSKHYKPGFPCYKEMVVKHLMGDLILPSPENDITQNVNTGHLVALILFKWYPKIKHLRNK